MQLKYAAVKRFRGRSCDCAESDACGTFEAIKRFPILYAPSPRPPFIRNRFCRGSGWRVGILRLFEPRSSPPPPRGEQQPNAPRIIRVIPHFSFSKKKNEWNLFRPPRLRCQSSLAFGGMTDNLFHKTGVKPATRQSRAGRSLPTAEARYSHPLILAVPAGCGPSTTCISFPTDSE